MLGIWCFLCWKKKITCKMKKIDPTILALTSLLVLFLAAVQSEKLPVIVVHGINGRRELYEPLLRYISEEQAAYFIESDLGLLSAVSSMKEQLEHLVGEIEDLKERFAFSDHHLVCHSQGTLLCRAYLQWNSNHTCQNFIALTGPQMGQFGVNLIKGNPYLKYIPVTKEIVWLPLYTSIAQSFISPSNYWKDPFHYDRYLESVKFLPQLNNETGTEFSDSSRENFLKLKLAVFTGSNGDAIIEPYQSALFEFWKINQDSEYELKPMHEQEVYKSDFFGLKTLEKEGRLVMLDIPGIGHTEWVKRRDLFDKYIKPYI